MNTRSINKWSQEIIQAAGITLNKDGSEDEMYIWCNGLNEYDKVKLSHRKVEIRHEKISLIFNFSSFLMYFSCKINFWYAK